jgi:WD40 repeat protein
MAVRPDGRMLASGSIDGRVCLWDLETQPGEFGPPARTLTEPGRQVWSVAFSPDGRLLASGSIDGTVRLWGVATGRVVHELATGATPAPAPVAFSPDGEVLAAGGENGSVHLWAVKTGQPKESVRWHNVPVSAVAFSPDGRWLASGGFDRTVQLVDRASGRRVHTFRVNTPVTAVAFSADSQTLAATADGPDPPVRLWDVGTRAERTLTGHTRPVPGLAFAPGGRRVASTSLDGIARLWETTPGIDQSRSFDLHHVGPTAGVAFTPSGRHLAVGLSNGLIAILRTPPAPAR